MSQGPHKLGNGVTIARRDGDEPLELLIRAADLDELVWRLHDLIPLIQSGELNRVVAGLSPKADPQRPGKA
ncbi:MAG: hypothetical protein BIFFINMI_00110 [Phycisphaerae bacterium]|nr:hypothetical protein [Phycisphaerae bacterium]